MAVEAEVCRAQMIESKDSVQVGRVGGSTTKEGKMITRLIPAYNGSRKVRGKLYREL